MKRLLHWGHVTPTMRAFIVGFPFTAVNTWKYMCSTVAHKNEALAEIQPQKSMRILNWVWEKMYLLLLHHSREFLSLCLGRNSYVTGFLYIIM